MTITALAAEDKRAYEIRVAEPAALLVAKVHKLVERIDVNNKDAFDIFRLLRAVDADELTEVALLLTHPISAPVTVEAITRFRDLFETVAAGTQLVVKHVAGIENQDIIVASCVALSQELIEKRG